MANFARAISNFVGSLSIPNLARLFLFLFLLLSIPLTVISIKSVRDIRSLAATTLDLRLDYCTDGSRILYADYTHTVDVAVWKLTSQLSGDVEQEIKDISNEASGTQVFAPPKGRTFTGRLRRSGVLQVEKSILVSDCAPPPDTTPPTPPGNLRVTNKTTNSVSLAWDASTDSGGLGLAGYKVYRNGAQVATTTSTSYTNSSLTPSTAYSYYVKAYDNANNSANSSTISVTTLATPPPPPTSGGGSSGGKKTGGSSGNTVVSYLETLQLEISVPYLIGKLEIKANVGGVAKELKVLKDNKSYILDLKGSNLVLNKEYNLALSGEKTLIKKVRFTPTTASFTVNAGELVLGDLNQDNRIDKKDQDLLIKSIASQTLLGDLNADKDTNSLDWAIVLTNSGKKGD